MEKKGKIRNIAEQVARDLFRDWPTDVFPSQGETNDGRPDPRFAGCYEVVFFECFFSKKNISDAIQAFENAGIKVLDWAVLCLPKGEVVLLSTGTWKDPVNNLVQLCLTVK